MAAESKADISVVICTRNRAESLRQTLECLARAEKGTLRCEVVVVDTASSDHTREVVRGFAEHLPVHFLTEPLRGKGRALNRALDEAPLGEIVAVLDDDMSPHPDWFLGVKAICDRWPGKDLFTGKSYAIWPAAEVPEWCSRPYFRNWVFSVMDFGPKDRPLIDGWWFSGNHFWFRSRVLAGGRRFNGAHNDPQLAAEGLEADFQLQLVEDGYGGVAGPDAVCGHRIQPELLDLDFIQERAARIGCVAAFARMQPYKSRVKHTRLFRKHPILARIYCVLCLLKWSVVGLLVPLNRNPAIKIEKRLESILKIAEYRGFLSAASRMQEYRVFHRQ